MTGVFGARSPLPGASRLSLELLCEILTPHWPEAQRFLELAQQFPARAAQIRGAFLQRARTLGIDLDDPFQPPPTPQQLDGDGSGIVVGEAGGHPFHYLSSEWATGIVLLGSPRSGKTVGVISIVLELRTKGCGVLIPDLRGDYRVLAESVPGVLYVPSLVINIFEPPLGVPLTKWMHVIAARLTCDLGLEFASLSYVIQLLGELCQRAERAGVLPTLLDFYDLLKRQRPVPRSSTEGYLERVTARVRTLIEVCGEETFAVQQGHPVTQMVEQGRIVVLDLRVERRIADLLTSVLIYRMYYRLLFDDPYERARKLPVFCVLDEQRSLIRAQPLAFGVPDIELLFSRSRALGLGVLTAEQIPGAVNPALLSAPLLKLLFNLAAPEQRLGAALLGLDPYQAAQIPTLAPGECIARLAGNRLPMPFRLKIPLPGILK